MGLLYLFTAPQRTPFLCSTIFFPNESNEYVDNLVGKFRLILLTLKVHYFLHKNIIMDPVLSQMSPGRVANCD